MSSNLVVRSKFTPMTVDEMLEQTALVIRIMKSVMQENVHYGIVPGTDKPSLWKPGAEKLCVVFHIGDRYRIEDLSDDDSTRYRIVCVGEHQTTGTFIGEGLGEASSNEKKYKWIKAYPTEWNHTPEDRRRTSYGWDFDKKEEYEIKQVRAEPADISNTILKMAAKRAKIAMTINATACSDIFTQDLEDMDERVRASLAGEQVQPTKTVDVKGFKQPKSRGNGGGNGAAASTDPNAPVTDGEIAFLRNKTADDPELLAAMLGNSQLKEIADIKTKAQWTAAKAFLVSKGK